MKTLKTLKTLTKKSEITAKELKTNDVDFNGKRLGHDGDYYVIGSHHNLAIFHYCDTVTDLKACL